jgi:tetratricopeptide (TPR) repeat protein
MVSSALRLFAVTGIAICLVACAIPRDQRTFSVRADDREDGHVFFSTEALRAAGLTSESISYGTKGRLFDAECRLRRALVLNPNSERISFNLAVVLSQSGNYEEALSILEALRTTQGAKPHILLALADCKNAQGYRAQAREVLKELFGIYKAAGNYPQAALVARSIANSAFGEGLESEALCYSFEGLFLAPSSQQLGAHASLLVAMNLFKAADDTLSSQVAQAPAIGAAVSVHHAWALAKYGLGDTAGALKQIEIAQDFSSENPELSGEVNVLWWVIKKQMPVTEESSDSIAEKLDALYPDVVRLRDKPTYSLIRWPVALRTLLDGVPGSID